LRRSRYSAAYPVGSRATALRWAAMPLPSMALGSVLTRPLDADCRIHGGWLADREAELLPVPCFHVVYTVPSELRDIAYQNKRVVYDLHMEAAAETTPGLRRHRRHPVRLRVSLQEGETVIKPIDPDSPMKPATTKRQGVAIELHSATEHMQVFREITRPPRGKPVLGAPATLDASATGSPYAAVLQRAASVAGVTLW
jgi:hypothetical protein